MAAEFYATNSDRDFALLMETPTAEAQKWRGMLDLPQGAVLHNVSWDLPDDAPDSLVASLTVTGEVDMEQILLHIREFANRVGINTILMSGLPITNKTQVRQIFYLARVIL
jgi:hypothetical protein